MLCAAVQRVFDVVRRTVLRCVALCCVALCVHCCRSTATPLPISSTRSAPSSTPFPQVPLSRCGTPCHTVKPLSPTNQTHPRRCAALWKSGNSDSGSEHWEVCCTCACGCRTCRQALMPVRACAQTRTSRSSRSRTSWRSTTSRQRMSPRATYSAYACAVLIALALKGGRAGDPRSRECRATPNVTRSTTLALASSRRSMGEPIRRSHTGVVVTQ